MPLLYARAQVVVGEEHVTCAIVTLSNAAIGSKHLASNTAHDGNTQRLRRVICMHSLPSCAPVLGLLVLPNANHASILARS